MEQEQMTYEETIDFAGLRITSFRAGSLSDQIYDFAEPGMEEIQSSRLLTEYLKAKGFEVECGIAGLPTAFRAVYEQGSGGPSFGFLAEYDAIKDIGHACGHHMQGPSVIGAALALRDVCGEEPYKIVIYGTPAEETIGGKIIMKEKGCFQDIDIALMMHAAPNTCVDVRCMALECYYVTFHGVESHAAMSPHKGKSAFDSALLSFQAIEFLREHLLEDSRMHYTILDAGGPSNIVPGRAKAEYTLRSYNTDYLENVIVPRFQDILKGACLMTGTTCEIERSYPFQAKIPCMTLNNLIMENAEEFKAPQLAGPREKTGSTDFGNVMYDVPGCCTSRYRLIINNGFCNSFVIRSKRRLMIVPKKEKPITAFLICALSALRLCVWLFDN